MHGRAVGVSMDQSGHAEAGEGGFNRLRIHVGDGLEAGPVAVDHFLLPAHARLPRLCGEGLARGQRLGQELRLPVRVAGLRTEGLVGVVVGAQQVTVHQQHRLAVQRHHRRVGQDAHAGAAGVVLADQEIAVAVDEVHRHAGVGEPAQTVGHLLAG